MKKLYLFIAIFTLSLYIKAQDINTFSLKSLADSFNYSESGYTKKFAFRMGDTMAFGTALYSNVFKIKTDIDSIKIKYNPKQRPYKQVTCIKIKSPDSEQILYVNFQESNCWFTDEYIEKATGEPIYEIPEIYELANVLYTLTNSSLHNQTRTYKGTKYYNEVLSYFAKFRNHLLIKQLEFTDSPEGSKDYYNFRDNSICFKVNNGSITPNNQYYAVWGKINENLFAKQLALINDFYKKSQFHKFYSKHKSFYDSLIKLQQEYMPTKKMWHWLEQNFSGKINSYKIVFSPLIWGSHGTQSFYWFSSQRKLFTQAIMFVSGDRGISNDSALNEKQKEGIASGIVFTEIDHNYCNSVSFRYQKEIDSAFSNREKWVQKGGDGDAYPSAMDVFNEYITHAIYLLYAYDNFNKEDFEIIRKPREELMIKQRRYIKFKEFTDALLNLYQTKESIQAFADLFPKIIEWCSVENSLARGVQ